MDTSWAETGDRYLLKLFRDYLFHQVTEDGRPWLDTAHVVQCLNKACIIILFPIAIFPFYQIFSYMNVFNIHELYTLN